MSERKVRVRFAPSPTGALHIGGVRTALYNYLFAKSQGGDMIFRIEDTDSKRFVPGAEAYIIEALTWLGIRFDEGVSFGGDHGPYRQSERRDIYKKYVDELVAKGAAYYAFDTPAELEAAHTADPNFQYDAHSRMKMVNSLTLSPEEVKERIGRGDVYTVRFRIEPEQTILIHDMIRGEVTYKSDVLDDKVLYKSADQLPTYHLANVVDDHLMEVTHVIRGEEWLPSTPLHILLYRAFGWEETMPEFAHLPLLLKPDGKGKLSKRDGDRLNFPVFPLDWIDPVTGALSKGYREAGYFPEAVINFLALLGWNPGTEQEMFTMEELIDTFSIARCSKAGAKFDYEKGKWFNHQYMLLKSNAELAEQVLPFLEAEGLECVSEALPFDGKHFTRSYVEQVLELIKDRMNFIQDFWANASYFFKAPETYDEKTVAKRWKPESPQQMNELISLLEPFDFTDPVAMEEAAKAWTEANAYGMGIPMNALRLAVVGEGKGPHIFHILKLIGKEETFRRIKRAIEVLG